MEFELQPSTDDAERPDVAEGSSFSLSSRPVIARDGKVEGTDSLHLPRTYGTRTLCLMARDPRTLFAYWDIDWAGAFRDEAPKDRKVQLRVLSDEDVEIALTEVEPMAGNCYVTVAEADAAYKGEIGYFDSAGIWKRLASSDVVTTPAEASSATEELDFATVPFHLSFQYMIDLLRISKQENESLTSMLADLRTRAASPEKKTELSPEEKDLARVLEEAAPMLSSGGELPGRSDSWTQDRIERILRLSESSPSEGFGGSGPGCALGGSSRPI